MVLVSPLEGLFLIDPSPGLKPGASADILSAPLYPNFAE
jgi:hypothetical protein